MQMIVSRIMGARRGVPVPIYLATPSAHQWFDHKLKPSSVMIGKQHLLFASAKRWHLLPDNWTLSSGECNR